MNDEQKGSIGCWALTWFLIVVFTLGMRLVMARSSYGQFLRDAGAVVVIVAAAAFLGLMIDLVFGLDARRG